MSSRQLGRSPLVTGISKGSLSADQRVTPNYKGRGSLLGDLQVEQLQKVGQVDQWIIDESYHLGQKLPWNYLTKVPHDREFGTQINDYHISEQRVRSKVGLFLIKAYAAGSRTSWDSSVLICHPGWDVERSAPSTRGPEVDRQMVQRIDLPKSIAV